MAAGGDVHAAEEVIGRHDRRRLPVDERHPVRVKSVRQHHEAGCRELGLQLDELRIVADDRGGAPAPRGAGSAVTQEVAVDEARDERIEVLVAQASEELLRRWGLLGAVGDEGAGKGARIRRETNAGGERERTR